MTSHSFYENKNALNGNTAHSDTECRKPKPKISQIKSKVTNKRTRGGENPKVNES